MTELQEVAKIDTEVIEEPEDPRIDAYAGDYFKTCSEIYPHATSEERKKFLTLSVIFARERIVREDADTAEVRDLKQQARKDKLTGLDNRRSFEEEAHRAIAEAMRTGQPVSLCFVDIDDFKITNDTYGHQNGDKTLQEVAETIVGGIRESDRACRYGGEEFAIICPATSQEQTLEVAERQRQNVDALAIEAENGPIRTTISTGVSTFIPRSSNMRSPSKGITNIVNQLVSNADTAMYAAKAAGKNCVGYIDSTNQIFILKRGSTTQPQLTTVFQNP